jgi:hypothetical protein
MEKLADTIETTEMPMLDEMLVTDEMPSEGEIVIVDEPRVAEEKEFDWEKNKDFAKFLKHLRGKIGKVPQHSGKTTAGCERAIVYLKMVDKEISKAVGEDLDCKLDDQEVEKMRKEIRKMIKQLQKRHNEINDAYDADDEKFASSEPVIKAAALTYEDLRAYKEHGGHDDAHANPRCVYCREKLQSLDPVEKLKKELVRVNRELEEIRGYYDQAEYDHGHITDDESMDPEYQNLLGIKENIRKKLYDIDPDYFMNDPSITTKPKTASEQPLRCKKCGAKVATRAMAKAHADTKHPGEDITFSDYVEGAPVEVAKSSHDCSCEIKKNAAPEDGNCPSCKVKLWGTDTGVLECIACEAIFEGSLKKEATTPSIQLIMTPLERALTGILINGYVSQGKQIEPAFAELKKAYKLTEREELSVMQLMLDMGYPTARNFMGMPHSNDIEFATNYKA